MPFLQQVWVAEEKYKPIANASPPQKKQLNNKNCSVGKLNRFKPSLPGILEGGEGCQLSRELLRNRRWNLGGSFCSRKQIKTRIWSPIEAATPPQCRAEGPLLQLAAHIAA